MTEDEKKESGVVYEDPIDIPIDNDEDEEDEEDEDESMDSSEETNVETPSLDNQEDKAQGTIESNDPETSTQHFPVTTSAAEDSKKQQIETTDEEPATKKIKTEENSSNQTATATIAGSNEDNMKEKDETPKYDSGKGKKVPLHLLEKRRIGRIKAAEEFAKRLKKIGIEKVESTTLPHSGGFGPLTVINQKNYSSDYIRKDEQIFALRERKSLRSGVTNPTTTSTTQQEVSPSTSNTPDQTIQPSVASKLAPLEDNITINITSASEFTSKNDDIDFSDAASTIVIQPGSESIKIGFALDDKPLIIPNCIAIPTSRFNENHQRSNQINKLQIQQPKDFDTLKENLQETFKQRMRYYKRRIQSNSYEQVSGFNSVTRGEPVPDLNENGKTSWIETPKDDTIYIGEDALRCTDTNFIHRKPFCCSGGGAIFNISDDNNYSSIEEVYGDAVRIIKYATKRLIKRRQDRRKKSELYELYTSEQIRALMEDVDEHSIFKSILIIPDTFEKTHVENMIRLLLTELNFNAVALMQESLAACYGTGTGVSTCVVNVGANKTNIACVDDGSVVENSCVTLDYGGDDITRLFAKLLLMSNFPYESWDVNNVSGWKNAEMLKKQCITFQDVDVTTQSFNFIKRVPGERTEKIEFKTFDEVMLAPLALFEPKIFTYLKQNSDSVAINKNLRKQLPISRDLFTNIPNDWESLTQDNCRENKLYSDFQDNFALINNILDNILENREVEDPSNNDQKLNLIPLDKAIIQSITNAALDVDVTKLSSFYSNILVIGGTSKIPAFDFMLTDRINIWRPRLLSLNSFANFYKSLLEKIKELETNAKNNANVITSNNDAVTPNNTKNDDEDEDEDEEGDAQAEIVPKDKLGEDNLRGQIDSMVKQELEKYMKETEAHTSSEHYLPVSVVPAPHDRDPSLMLWKGATVLAQLKLIEELYITETDWDVHGSRILQHKCLFAY